MNLTTEWALRSLRDPERILPGTFPDRAEAVEAAQVWNAQSPNEQVEAVWRNVTPWEVAAREGAAP